MAATEAGSAAGAVIEGFLSGVERGQAFQRRRTVDRQTAEELERRREQAELDRTRQGIIDEREGERARREEETFEIGLFERGLERLPEGVTPGAPTAPTGRPQDRDVIEMRDRLREGVGDQLAPTGVPEAPPGFRRVGPSVGEREEVQRREQAALVGEFLGAPEEERRRMIADPSTVLALRELGQLGAAEEAFEEAAPAGPRIGVSAEGKPTLTGARTPEEAEEFMARFPAIAAGADPELVFNQTNALADDFRNEASVVIDVAAAVARARAAGDNAVGDQTKIIALNKLLDPGSIVREGEFNRVGQAGGLARQAEFFFNKLKDGRLADELRRELDAEIDAQAQEAEQNFAPTMDRFRARAEGFGLDPTQVVFNPFGVSGDTGAEDARIEELIDLGLTDEQIEAVLRQEAR